MGTSVYFNNGAAIRESQLLEDLIIESIKNHGIDVYYMPRESESQLDRLFGDDPVKSFSTAYPIEMYLESTSDFEGQQEFFSKFGLEVDKQARVSVARRTFTKYIPADTRITPKEGDLIFIPVLQKLMEIKFVEQERNFFQLGKGAGQRSGGAFSQFGKVVPYMFELSLVAFKYNGERLKTGIFEIDSIADAHAYGIEFTMQAGGTDTYEQHEIVYQGSSVETATARGYVSKWDVPTRKLIIRNIKGSFAANTSVNGVNSGAQWTLVSGNPQENAADAFEENVLIENEADNILDWTETNPFGSSDENY